MNSKDKQKRKKVSNNKKFSLKGGLPFFCKNSAFLGGLILLLFINGAELHGIILFSSTYLIFNIFFSLLACYRPEENRSKYIDLKKFTKNEFYGLIIAIAFTSLFSLIFYPIPFPSKIVMLIFTGNFAMAFYSIFFHRISILLYESSVYDRTDSIKVYFYKYLNIFYFGINYEVQKILIRFPILINILISLIFMLIMLIQFFSVLTALGIE